MNLADKKKLVVIGDGACGKTCLLMVYTKRVFPNSYIPTVFEQYSKDIKVDGSRGLIRLLLMDTSGQEDYERLRSLQYVDVNVFILCFSIDSRTSFENVSHKWIPEIKQIKCPVILVGTRLDLRNDDNSADCISAAEAIRLGKRIKAFAYVECSSKLLQGVDEVFLSAAKAAVKYEKSSHSKCYIL